MAADPYLENEKDPTKSQALDSSLWEIQMLQNHVLPRVASMAHFINNPLPSVEWDLSSLLDFTSDNVRSTEMCSILSMHAIYAKCNPATMSFTMPCLRHTLRKGRHTLPLFICSNILPCLFLLYAFFI